MRFILLLTLVAGLAGSRANDPVANPLAIELTPVRIPGAELRTAVLRAEITPDDARGWVHTPRTRGGSEGYDLGFDVTIDYGHSNIDDSLSEATLLYRNGNTYAFSLATERKSHTLVALVVITGRTAMIYLDEHQWTRVPVEYEVVLDYHHLHETLLKTRPNLLKGQEQQHTSSNPVTISVRKP